MVKGTRETHISVRNARSSMQSSTIGNLLHVRRSYSLSKPVLTSTNECSELNRKPRNRPEFRAALAHYKTLFKPFTCAKAYKVAVNTKLEDILERLRRCFYRSICERVLSQLVRMWNVIVIVLCVCSAPRCRLMYMK
jgi:hypothetical protein